MSNLRIFLYGFLVGIFDLIPGISGSTILYLLGIYERLIHCLSQLNFKNFMRIFKIIFNLKKLKTFLAEKDFIFLFILSFGVLSSITLLSFFINFLLESFKKEILSFFAIMIFISIFLFYSKMKYKNHKNLLFSFFGFLFCFGIFLVSNFLSLNSNLNFLVLFFVGFFISFAMILPGISGSQILLVIGLYEPLLKEFSKFNFVFLLPFFVGIVFGIVLTSKILDKLLDKYKIKIEYFLFGMILSSIFILVYLILNL